MKRFLQWIEVKIILDQKNINLPFVSERDIWWASIGKNIGTEINGKNKRFTRPVIIFKKLAPGFFFAIPLTSNVKGGSWYVTFFQQRKHMSACLHQARAIDYRRLSEKIGSLNQETYEIIRNKFRKLYDL